MYNESTKEIPEMKKFAIILSILCFAPAAFAGGTVLYTNPHGYVPEQGVQNATNADKNQDGEKKVSTKKERSGKFRVGTQKNDPNTYWNFGRVNFGSGFSSEGSSTKRF